MSELKIWCICNGVCLLVDQMILCYFGENIEKDLWEVSEWIGGGIM